MIIIDEPIHFHKVWWIRMGIIYWLLLFIFIYLFIYYLLLLLLSPFIFIRYDEFEWE
jgi:hypothetical protein